MKVELVEDEDDGYNWGYWVLGVAFVVSSAFAIVCAAVAWLSYYLMGELKEKKFVIDMQRDA